MTLLLLVPWLALTVLQVPALVGLRGEATARDLTLGQVALPASVFAAAFVLAASALALALVDRRGSVELPLVVLVVPAVLAALAICAAPLLWGRAIDEFHLAHHMVRGGVVAGSLVLYFLHVAAHR